MSRGVDYVLRIATCILHGPSFPTEPKSKTEYLPVNTLSVLTWESRCWQYWLYFTPFLWSKTRSNTPGPTLGMYSSWRANCQWIWNRVFPAPAPDFLAASRSGLIGWCGSCGSDNELGVGSSFRLADLLPCMPFSLTHPWLQGMFFITF